MKIFLIYWVPVLAWALLIFYLSGLPGVKVSYHPILNEIIHYVAHFFVYFMFAFLLARAFDKEGLEIQKTFFLSFIIAGLYAIGDEYHQIFVSSRSPDIKDIVFDWLGILFSLQIFRVGFNKKISR